MFLQTWTCRVGLRMKINLSRLFRSRLRAVWVSLCVWRGRRRRRRHNVSSNAFEIYAWLAWMLEAWMADREAAQMLLDVAAQSERTGRVIPRDVGLLGRWILISLQWSDHFLLMLLLLMVVASYIMSSLLRMQMVLTQISVRYGHVTSTPSSYLGFNIQLLSCFAAISRYSEVTRIRKGFSTSTSFSGQSIS